jgi:hypothetical protein
MYSVMHNKQKRIVEREVEVLFSVSAFLRSPTIDELMCLDPFHPSIKYKNGTLFMSKKGIAALKRLNELISGLPELCSNLSVHEIHNQVFQYYSDCLAKSLQPTGQEFVDEIINHLLSQVKHYEFLAKVEGINLCDIDSISLGSFRIQRSDPLLFDHIAFKRNLDREKIYSQFKDCLWLIGSVEGSSDIAAERFDYRAVLTVGILGLCGAIFYKGAIWRTRVRVVTSPLENREAVMTLKWESGGKNPSLSRTWGVEQDLPLNAEIVAYLSETCFFDRLSNLPEVLNRCELEDALLHAIYWFADAYRDRNPVMQFVKLWTCAECFFAIDKEQITELNAMGIATILVFGGYRVIEAENYIELKRKVKRFYDLRSRAIHRAEFTHIDLKDLNEFSYWIAWVVISMVALTEQGYKTLNQIHEQLLRLDNISSNKNC